MAFTDQLKKLMNEKNMKAADLARATGLSEAAISDYLKGKKEPRGRQSIAIAKALNVSLDRLWETTFNSDKSNNTVDLSSLSANKIDTINKIKNMSDDEVKAILAFVNSLDEVNQTFKE